MDVHHYSTPDKTTSVYLLVKQFRVKCLFAIFGVSCGPYSGISYETPEGMLYTCMYVHNNGPTVPLVPII